MGGTFVVLAFVTALSPTLFVWTVPFDLTVFQYYCSKTLQCWSRSPQDTGYPNGTQTMPVERPLLAPVAGLYQTVLQLKAGDVLYWNAPSSAEFDLWVQSDLQSPTPGKA